MFNRLIFYEIPIRFTFVVSVSFWFIFSYKLVLVSLVTAQRIAPKFLRKISQKPETTVHSPVRAIYPTLSPLIVRQVGDTL